MNTFCVIIYIYLWKNFTKNESRNLNRSCSGLFFLILSRLFSLTDLDKWENKKKIQKICWLKLRELWFCLEAVVFGYIFVYWSLIVPSWLGWLIETGCQKQDETRCWPVSSRWQHEASRRSLAAFRFIKLWHFSHGSKLFFPRLFFVTYLLFRMCTVFFDGIFRCFISDECERQFCFVVLAAYFSFQLF